MKKLAILLGVVLFLLCGAPAYANGVPALPHAFYGNVTINGSPAPAGTTVEARGEGVATGVDGNPITTTDSGIYGSSSPFEPKLVVQGDIEEGATITFYVNGVSTGQTATWHSGETTAKNLSVTMAAPPPGPPGEGTIKTNIFGTKGSIRIDSDGIVLEIFTVTSPDDRLTLTIPRGTKALDKDGNPLASLTAAVDESPPDPPEGDNIIGLSYNFGPDGATFDPPITLTWSYDPDALPEGVAEEDLTIAYYDEEAGEWVELDCEVDTVNNIITASVSHYTTFATIAIAAPPAPPPAPAPAPPAPPPAPAPAPPAPPPAPPSNWPMIGGIIAAAVVAVLLIYFLVRRRAH